MPEPDIRLSEPARQSLLRVAVTMEHAPANFPLLCSNPDGIVDGCHILFNPPAGTSVDFWIVAGNARAYDMMHCAPENTLFIAWEPLEKKLYPHRFYQQFHWVVDSHPYSRHPRLEIDALGLCWNLGLKRPDNVFEFGYQRLSTLPCPAKQNQISVVCSSDRFSPGQRLRLDFLEAAKRELGDKIVHFGRGFTPVADKLDAMLPYRYHLVLENCQEPNYWTEKISDAYLAWAYPLYLGCPNLERSFPERCFVRVDPANVAESIATMRRMLETPESAAQPAVIAEARDLVLHHWNPYHVWARRARERWRPLPQRKTILWSHKAFRTMFRGWLFRGRALRSVRKAA